MNKDPYSLDNLRDIMLPDAPPLWPPAPGAWLLLAILAGIILLLVLQLHTARKRNAYRRAGMALLHSANTVHDVSVCLKRVALAIFPRQQVASLYGEDWVVFLNNSCAQCRFAVTDLEAPVSKANAQLIEQAAIWIQQHRRPDAAPEQRPMQHA
ncbi:MAG: DUF4381 domain-containing protein [Gammaproteobacteria bacterium]